MWFQKSDRPNQFLMNHRKIDAIQFTWNCLILTASVGKSLTTSEIAFHNVSVCDGEYNFWKWISKMAQCIYCVNKKHFPIVYWILFSLWVEMCWIFCLTLYFACLSSVRLSFHYIWMKFAFSGSWNVMFDLKFLLKFPKKILLSSCLDCVFFMMHNVILIKTIFL